MGHQSLTAFSIGDRVTEISDRESEIIKSTCSLWPTRRIAAGAPTITRRKRSKTKTFRHPRKDTDWLGCLNVKVAAPLVAAAAAGSLRQVAPWGCCLCTDSRTCRGPQK